MKILAGFICILLISCGSVHINGVKISDHGNHPISSQSFIEKHSITTSIWVIPNKHSPIEKKPRILIGIKFKF